jgi:predicted PurR-regulated permease PerM
MTLALAAILLLTVPSLVTQLFALFENAPKERTRLLAWLGQYDAAAPLVKAIKAVPLDELFAGAGRQLLGYSSEIVAGIGYSVTTLFLSIYLLADSTRVTGALYSVVPREYHVRLARIMLHLEVIVGGYVRGQVITSAMITVFMFGLLSILGVPNALALAVFGGITDVIPFIGGILAIAPAALAALGVGPIPALVVLIAMFVYQELESRVLVPRLYGHVLRISPVVVLLALLIGGTLLGILGALLALPIAAGVQMMVRELRFDLPGDDRDDSHARLRDERAEAAYERMTAGAPAVEAAVVAGKIAETTHEQDEAKKATDGAK